MSLRGKRKMSRFHRPRGRFLQKLGNRKYSVLIYSIQSRDSPPTHDVSPPTGSETLRPLLSVNERS